MARIGKRVLHMDPNGFYGADWGSFPLTDLVEYVRSGEAARPDSALNVKQNRVLAPWPYVGAEERTTEALAEGAPAARFFDVETWSTVSMPSARASAFLLSRDGRQAWWVLTPWPRPSCSQRRSLSPSRSRSRSRSPSATRSMTAPASRQLLFPRAAAARRLHTVCNTP